MGILVFTLFIFLLKKALIFLSRHFSAMTPFVINETRGRTMMVNNNPIFSATSTFVIGGYYAGVCQSVSNKALIHSIVNLTTS